MDMATLLKEIEAWPIENQVEFVQRAWDQIVDSNREADLTEEEKAELDRRLAAREANPKSGSSWQEVKARIWGSA
jgi:putative addiction module component (TIGR02574 family)